MGLTPESAQGLVPALHYWTMTVPVIPTLTWTSQLYGTDPAFGNVIVTLQALAAALPLPPLPSQPFAQRNEPSLATTLWRPPRLVKVTVPPAAIVTVDGLNVLLLFKFTIALCAGSVGLVGDDELHVGNATAMTISSAALRRGNLHLIWSLPG